jgi:predicted metal-dependent enzyme (double-stranded beta helix superfamily)
MEPYSIRAFIADAESVTNKYSNESEVLRRLGPLLARLVAGARSVPKKAFTPRKDRFAMNLLHMPEDERLSIIAAVWLPGQTTPIHDHLTWALVGVYEGEEREALFRRTDDGSDSKFAKLTKVSERVNKKGHVSVLGSKGIHRVDNLASEPARSIHVYGRDIGSAERHSYDPMTGEISRFVSGYCNVLRDMDRY